MDITKCLTVSTAHVSEETMGKLKLEPEVNQLGLAVYEKSEYGFWVHIPEYLSWMSEQIPADLFQCLSLAQSNDCQWLSLDCDGEELDCLPIYDW